jgi:hypothetical protein
MFDLNYYNKICRFGKMLDEIVETNRNMGNYQGSKHQMSISKEARFLEIQQDKEEKLLMLMEMRKEHKDYLAWYENYDERNYRNFYQSAQTLSGEGYKQQKAIIQRQLGVPL